MQETNALAVSDPEGVEIGPQAGDLGAVRGEPGLEFGRARPEFGQAGISWRFGPDERGHRRNDSGPSPLSEATGRPLRNRVPSCKEM